VFLSTLQASGRRTFQGTATFYQGDTLVSASDSGPLSTDSYSRNDGVQTGLTAEYHLPAGTHWQLDAVSSASLSEGGERLFSTSELAATWLIADRWFANATLNHELSAEHFNVDRAVDSWEVRCGASLSYFLEDSWALQLGMAEDQLHTSIAYQRQDTFSIGISYVFTGLLAAPGLFEPMRLTPPAR